MTGRCDGDRREAVCENDGVLKSWITCTPDQGCRQCLIRPHRCKNCRKCQLSSSYSIFAISRLSVTRRSTYVGNQTSGDDTSLELDSVEDLTDSSGSEGRDHRMQVRPPAATFVLDSMLYAWNLHTINEKQPCHTLLNEKQCLNRKSGQNSTVSLVHQRLGSSHF